MDKLSDEAIANIVQEGDAEAFGQLIERYEAKLRRYAQKFLHVEHEIDDLVQDIFVKVYTNIQSFDSNQRFSPWIYRIAHNSFINELKRKSRGGLGVFDADVFLPQLPATETADESALKAEVTKEMESLIQNLSSKYREVVVLHYFESLSYQEISEVLRIPVTTVGVRLLRAKAKLREHYQADNSFNNHE